MLKFLALTKAKLLVVAGVTAGAVALLVVGTAAVVQGMRAKEASLQNFSVKGQPTREILTGVVAEGRYRYDQSGGIAAHIEGAFSISIQGNAWIASYKSTSALTNASERDAEVISSSDGTNTYVIHSTNPLKLQQLPAGEAPDVTVEAQVYPGISPPPMERHAYNLWIAFLSRNVWNKTTGRAKPPNTMDLAMFYDPDFFCEYVWTKQAQDAELPVLLLRSGREWLARDTHNNGKLRYLSMPTPYENGYTMAEACWLAATNVAGTVMPAKIKFSYLVPKTNAASAKDLRTYYTFQCLVTNTYTARIEAIPAGFERNQLVLVWDHRFASTGHPTITYGIAEGWSGAVDANTLARMMHMPRESLEHESLRKDGFNPPSE